MADSQDTEDAKQPSHNQADNLQKALSELTNELMKLNYWLQTLPRDVYGNPKIVMEKKMREL